MRRTMETAVNVVRKQRFTMAEQRSPFLNEIVLGQLTWYISRVTVSIHVRPIPPLSTALACFRMYRSLWSLCTSLSLAFECCRSLLSLRWTYVARDTSKKRTWPMSGRSERTTHVRSHSFVCFTMSAHLVHPPFARLQVGQPAPSAIPLEVVAKECVPAPSKGASPACCDAQQPPSFAHGRLDRRDVFMREIKA